MRKATALRSALRIALVAALFGAGTTPAIAQEDAETEKEPSEKEDAAYAEDESVPVEKCLRPKMIKSTHVLDDRNILFVMRNKKIYRNVLPRECRDLARIGAFSYPSTYGRVCDVDSIAVGGVAGGIGAMRHCRLGPFYPVTIPEIRALTREAAMTRDMEKDTEQ